ADLVDPVALIARQDQAGVGKPAIGPVPSFDSAGTGIDIFAQDRAPVLDGRLALFDDGCPVAGQIALFLGQGNCFAGDDFPFGIGIGFLGFSAGSIQYFAAGIRLAIGIGRFAVATAVAVCAFRVFVGFAFNIAAAIVAAFGVFAVSIVASAAIIFVGSIAVTFAILIIAVTFAILPFIFGPLIALILILRLFVGAFVLTVTSTSAVVGFGFGLIIVLLFLLLLLLLLLPFIL